MEAVKKYKVDRHFSIGKILFEKEDIIFVCSERDEGWYKIFLADGTLPVKVGNETRDKTLKFLTEITD